MNNYMYRCLTTLFIDTNLTIQDTNQRVTLIPDGSKQYLDPEGGYADPTEVYKLSFHDSPNRVTKPKELL